MVLSCWKRDINLSRSCRFHCGIPDGQLEATVSLFLFRLPMLLGIVVVALLHWSRQDELMNGAPQKTRQLTLSNAFLPATLLVRIEHGTVGSSLCAFVVGCILDQGCWLFGFRCCQKFIRLFCGIYNTAATTTTTIRDKPPTLRHKYISMLWRFMLAASYSAGWSYVPCRCSFRFTA